MVAENQRRAGTDRPPLIVMYDHIYWTLTFGSAQHVTPVGLVPEMAPYTVFVDGISKAFAATGVRVGWGVGPPSIISRMKDIIGHTGAWAPRAEQVATATLPGGRRGDGALPGGDAQGCRRPGWRRCTRG